MTRQAVQFAAILTVFCLSVRRAFGAFERHLKYLVLRTKTGQIFSRKIAPCGTEIALISIDEERASQPINQLTT